MLPQNPSADIVAYASRAILDLKIQRDKLHQYQKRITILTNRETEIAKQMLAQGDKKRALLALRRKKYQESLLTKTDAQLEQLEKLTSSVEFALIQKDVVFGLQQGTKVLQEIHQEMGGIEHVEKLMGDTADAIAYQKEVSDMLGNRITADDEDEVEAELAALEAQASGVSVPDNLPNVPNTNLPVQVPEREQQQGASKQPERQAMLAS
ncbi:uncharacterized protein E0L32_010427 [Thyridium curvatum]|uniref:Charged multivesicular body protein 6 n=1 Tax=Thyridium curvatum TaxID=1093900 RepID=A0A507AGD7_9PEZI|nr:uncharacterized protein E0L32_010427 [Thyridium curvatum]TPX07852.1 hypothetical protein E0L32_010427 [Thyridium curvatum]